MLVAACRPQGQGTAPSSGSAGQQNANHWPRTFVLPSASAVVYQPQVESWQANQLAFRTVVAATPVAASAAAYGVIWSSARTTVDPNARTVTLQDMALTRSNFPTLADNGAAYLGQLQQELATTPPRPSPSTGSRHRWRH